METITEQLTRDELKLLREMLGIHLVEVGKLMGVTGATISHIELGLRNRKSSLEKYNETLLTMIRNDECLLEQFNKKMETLKKIKRAL